jgi:hypothetical protein
MGTPHRLVGIVGGMEKSVADAGLQGDNVASRHGRLMLDKGQSRVGLRRHRRKDLEMRMLIRLGGACCCGIALVLTGMVVAAPEASAKAPVTASGTIECQNWTATAKFAPPLVFGAAGTSTLRFSGTFSDCSDAAGVTTGKVSGSATLPTDCTQDLNSSQSFNLGAVNFQIKWHGIGRFTETHGGSLSQGFFSESGPQSAATAGLLFIDGIDPSTTGSFASSGGGFLFGGQSTETPTQLGVNCTPKTKGQAGTGGLKKLTIVSGQLGAGT